MHLGVLIPRISGTEYLSLKWFGTEVMHITSILEVVQYLAGDWPSQLRLFMVFLSTSRPLLGQCLKISHAIFLSHLLAFCNNPTVAHLILHELSS